MIKTFEDAATSIDEKVSQTIGDFLEKIGDDELERLHHTLQLHLASSDGKNDLNVEELLEAVEFEQIHRG